MQALVLVLVSVSVWRSAQRGRPVAQLPAAAAAEALPRALWLALQAGAPLPPRQASSRTSSTERTPSVPAQARGPVPARRPGRAPARPVIRQAVFS